MGKIKTFLRICKESPDALGRAISLNLSRNHLSRLIPDKLYLKIQYRLNVGKKLNLKNPITYTAKLQWLKLYDRKTEYTKLVDKCKVRDFVKNKIGEEYLIPMLGTWKSFEEIDFNMLPNQFVLKCNHDSGSVVICKDKATFDYDGAKEHLTKALKRNMFFFGREWPYKDVKPCIIAEKYMADDENANKDNLTDYKIYCFGGVPKVMMLASDRFAETEARFDYVDEHFNWLDMEWGHPKSLEKPKKPKMFDEMFRLARVLSEGFAQIRVDFYESNGKVYFGEMTFFDGSGFEAITPYEWDIKMGEWIKLPQKKS